MPMYSLLSLGLVAVVFVVVATLNRRMRTSARQMYASLGGELGAAALTAAGKGDLAPYRMLLRQTADLDTRAVMAHEVGRSADVDAVAAWVAGAPRDPDAQLTWGASLIEQAWLIRGAGTNVAEAAIQGFRDRLAQAVAALRHAAAARPDDPTPWALQLICARGLAWDRQQTELVFGEAIRRDPECWLAHLNMLVYLTAKWHGSNEAMYEFARNASARAPQGSDLHTLVIVAHIERWVGLELIAGQRKAAKTYVANPAVHNECVAAYERGLGSPSLRARTSTQLARNYAAAWFYLAKDKPRLRHEIMAVGNAFTESPWHFFGASGESGFRQASKWAFSLNARTAGRP